MQVEALMHSLLQAPGRQVEIDDGVVSPARIDFPTS